MGLKSGRVAVPGAFQVSLGVTQGAYETWALGQNYVSYLLDTDGIYKIQRQMVGIEMDLAWQINRAWGLKLAPALRMDGVLSPTRRPGWCPATG